MTPEIIKKKYNIINFLVISFYLLPSFLKKDDVKSNLLIKNSFIVLMQCEVLYNHGGSVM